MNQDILIVDDDRSVRQTIAAYLQDSGYRVREAGGGAEGLASCRSESPALVLCDLRMPEVDGNEVITTLAREQPELPVIVVSGMGALSDAVGALRLGAWDYITKPIADMGVLEHAIEQALERARLLAENRRYREHLEAANQRLQESLRQLEEDEAAGRHIQFQLLPQRQLVLDGYSFDHQIVTSAYLSGDFVDYFRIDDQRIGFYMADVSGHGVSSAFITVLLKGHIARYLERYRQLADTTVLDPAATLAQLNRDLLAQGCEKYLTMFYAVLHSADRHLHYANAGQFPPALLRGPTGTGFISGKGMPVGLFDFASYKTEALTLPLDFALVLFSDGILDALGDAPLAERQAALLGAAATAPGIDAALERLGLNGMTTPPDDVTVLWVSGARA